MLAMLRQHSPPLQVLRRFHLLLLLVTVVFGILGVSRLSYNVDILDLLPKNFAGAEGTRLLRDTFEKAGQLIITVEAPSADAADRAIASLEAELNRHSDLVKRVIAQPTWESDAGQISSLAAYAWLNAPPERVAALRNKLASADLQQHLEEKINSLATEIDGMALTLGAYDPLGLLEAAKSGLDSNLERNGAGEFGSKDGKFRLLTVDAVSPLHSYRDATTWIRDIRSRIVEPWHQQLPDSKTITLGITGSPAFRAEISTAMEEDMSQSIGGITFIVGFLFWLLHRTIRPLFLLLASMLVSGLITLGIAGLAFGSLNVMSMGFAAILMGMIEDFGVVGLHEWLENPRDTFAQIHRRVFPGIFWSAVTSAAVFGSLTLSLLPGIAQLGLLTAVGILVGAAVMLYGFLPLAMKWSGRSHDKPRDLSRATAHPRWPGVAAAALLGACALVLTIRGFPGVVHDPALLHPKNCPAMEAMTRLQQRMQPPETQGEWVAVLLQRRTEAELCAAMDTARKHLESARAAGEISSFYLPDALFPNAQHQQVNHAPLAALAAGDAQVLQAMDAAGFTEDGLILAKNVFAVWKTWAAGGTAGLLWPSQALLEGSLGRLLHRTPDGVAASGFVRMPPGIKPATSPAVTGLEAIPGVYPGGWRYLNEKMRPLVGEEIRRVCLPAVAVLLVLLVVVFRNLRDSLLVLGSLTFSGLILLAAMQAFGIPWNFVNIGAVPLTLGLGLDFNIHMLFSLRRAADKAHAHGIGRALAYCGLSTSLGFGSLAMADNRGLVTFGQCAMIGVGATLFTAAFVLPWVYLRLGKGAAGN